MQGRRLGSGFADDAYTTVGAKIAPDAATATKKKTVARSCAILSGRMLEDAMPSVARMVNGPYASAKPMPVSRSSGRRRSSA